MTSIPTRTTVSPTTTASTAPTYTAHLHGIPSSHSSVWRLQPIILPVFTPHKYRTCEYSRLFGYIARSIFLGTPSKVQTQLTPKYENRHFHNVAIGISIIQEFEIRAFDSQTLATHTSNTLPHYSSSSPHAGTNIERSSFYLFHLIYFILLYIFNTIVETRQYHFSNYCI